MRHYYITQLLFSSCASIKKSLVIIMMWQQPLVLHIFCFKSNSLREASVAMGIVRVSSCMGHLKSHYMAGIMNMIGLGVPQELIQVC